MNKKAILYLADGAYFEGTGFGFEGETNGEICFNTSMTGYQEVLTDPSYYGQVIILNHSHFGNYGASENEVESNRIQIKGVICRNLSEKMYRPQANQSLHDYLQNEKIVGITDIDTRALVSHIRNQGAMNCIISQTDFDIQSLQSKVEQIPSMEGLELSSKVTTPNCYSFGESDLKKNIAVLDFGIKKNIIRNFEKKQLRGTVFPAKTDVKDLLEGNFDGYFLSNGPGDPSAMPYAIETAKQLLETNKPIFGICLGHQILALASGLKTYKLHNGHRGTNHPVLNLETGNSEITSQNHGFGVDKKSITSDSNIKITHTNLNDQSLEGFKRTDKPAFSVQYHPEASPGPHDSEYLFDQFLELLEKY